MTRERLVELRARDRDGIATPDERAELMELADAAAECPALSFAADCPICRRCARGLGGLPGRPDLWDCLACVADTS